AYIESERPDLMPKLQRWGSGWRDLCASVDVPCPDELVVLGDAMEHAYVQIYCPTSRHTYEMLTPEEAREQLAWVAESAGIEPERATRVGMVPVLGVDGHLLLLAADGSIHELLWDDPTDRVVAASLAELIRGTR